SIRCEPAARPKSDLYRDLLPILNGGRAQLLDHKNLVAQLCSLERRVARGGRDSIDHPPRQHDDAANAVAGLLTSLIIQVHFSITIPGGEFIRHGFSGRPAELTPDENYAEAAELADSGHLSGRDLYWFKLEQQRRARRAGQHSGERQ